MKKYLVFKYINSSNKNRSCNVGDYIQTIATLQFLDAPLRDNRLNFVARDSLALYEGEPAHVVMQGWFAHYGKQYRSFPVSDLLRPFYWGFHLSTFMDTRKILDDEGIVTSLRKAGPIGCRDPFTEEILREKGIDSFLSRCLTLTFPFRNAEKQYSKIISVDVPNASELLPKNILEHHDFFAYTNTYECLETDETPTEDWYLNYAKEMLGLYKNARVVFTGNLHTLLPCLAMGVPVYFFPNWPNELHDRYSVIQGLLDSKFINPKLKNTENLNSDKHSQYFFNNLTVVQEEQRLVIKPIKLKIINDFLATFIKFTDEKHVYKPFYPDEETSNIPSIKQSLAKRILYVGFDKYSDICRDVVCNFISDNFSVIEDDKNPEVIFCSTRNKNLENYCCTKVFFTSENAYPDFNRVDYAFSFLPDTINGRNFRFPPYFKYLWGESGKNLIKTKNPKLIVEEKRKFCNFVVSASSELTEPRERFTKMLMKYKNVDCPGKVLNNMATLDNHYSDENPWDYTKIKFLEQYKFTIAFENHSYSGYTTEKILHPMMANSIPIYWGNPDIGKEFNTKAFINCHDFASFDDVVCRVIEIDQNDQLYFDMLKESYFPGNQLPQSLREKAFKSQLQKIFFPPDSYIPVYQHSHIQCHGACAGLEVQAAADNRWNHFGKLSRKRKIWVIAKVLSKKLKLYALLRPLARLLKAATRFNTVVL